MPGRRAKAARGGAQIAVSGATARQCPSRSGPRPTGMRGKTSVGGGSVRRGRPKIRPGIQPAGTRENARSPSLPYVIPNAVRDLRLRKLALRQAYARRPASRTLRACPEQAPRRGDASRVLRHDKGQGPEAWGGQPPVPADSGPGGRAASADGAASHRRIPPPGSRIAPPSQPAQAGFVAVARGFSRRATPHRPAPRSPNRAASSRARAGGLRRCCPRL